jgi:hypothetical protein
MLGYIILTYGPKPLPNLKDHPAARQQLANLQYFAKQNKSEVKSAKYDYSRNITGFQSLPTLEKTLFLLREHKSGALIIDDLTRLFKACPIDKRGDLYEELIPFGAHIYGVRQKKTLSKINGSMLTALYSGYGSSRYILAKTQVQKKSNAERQMQTEDALIASQMSRTNTANQNSEKLDLIRSQLITENAVVTNAMIAEEANRQSFKTSRGGKWRRDTVSRTLKRLEQETLAQKAKHKLPKGLITD